MVRRRKGIFLFHGSHPLREGTFLSFSTVVVLRPLSRIHWCECTSRQHWLSKGRRSYEGGRASDGTRRELFRPGSAIKMSNRKLFCNHVRGVGNGSLNNVNT